MVFRETFEVEAPAEQVFAFASDLRTLPEWDGTVISVTGEAHGHVREGARYEVDLNFLGAHSRLRYHVEVFEPGRRAVLVGRNALFTATDFISVEEANDGCRLTWETEIRVHGLLGFAEPLLNLLFRASFEQSANGLRQALQRLPVRPARVARLRRAPAMRSRHRRSRAGKTRAARLQRR